MNRLKEARKIAGLTQQMMSDILGIPKRTIGNWETGSSSPVDWAEPMIYHTLMRLAEIMVDHRYIVVDDASVDVWQEFYETKKEANEAASNVWNNLTKSEQKYRHVYVTDIFGSDLDPDAFRDFVDDDIIDWYGYSQSGHDTKGCFDSDK